MADKIDQIKIGSSSYDIDLPPDAQISIKGATFTNTQDTSLKLIQSTNSSFARIHLYGSQTLGITWNDSSNPIELCGDGTIGCSKFSIPLTSGGSTFGYGTAGQVIKSNGSSAYWGDAASVDVPGAQETVVVVANATTNVNNYAASGYSSSDDTYNGYKIKHILYNSSTCSETKAVDYMYYMTGSNFLPTYRQKSPRNTLFLMSDGTIWKPQWNGSASPAGLNLWYMAKVFMDAGSGISLSGTDIALRTASSSSNDSGDLVWYYGNGNEKMRIWSEDTYSSALGPNFREFNSSGTSLFDGKIALMNCSNQQNSGTMYAGAFTTTGNVNCVAVYASSDKRLKENLEIYKSEKSILDLPIYKFDFIDGAKNQIGCLAQDLKEICPEIVQEKEDGYLGIQESKITYLLLDEVKKLKAEVNNLRDKLAALEDKK